MKLELKNVKIHPDMSEETTCFSATLWVDGKRAASCRNDGRGGSTDVYFEDRKLMLLVYQWCKDNPIRNWYREKEYIFDSLEARVDEMVIEIQYSKEFKSKEKSQLILRDKNSKDPEYIFHATFKLQPTINVLKHTEKGRESLKTAITKMRAKGYEIMNKNIDFKELGL